MVRILFRKFQSVPMLSLILVLALLESYLESFKVLQPRAATSLRLRLESYLESFKEFHTR